MSNTNTSAYRHERVLAAAEAYFNATVGHPETLWRDASETMRYACYDVAARIIGAIDRFDELCAAGEVTA